MTKTYNVNSGYYGHLRYLIYFPRPGKIIDQIWQSAITGELINDHHQLVRIAGQFSEDRKKSQMFYLLIDEVTYRKLPVKLKSIPSFPCRCGC
jgi:hypothetical protein